MTSEQHILVVPFPQGGHGINNMSLASVLASPLTKIHVPLCSLERGRQWLKASGRDAGNPNIRLVEVAGGKWADHDSYPAMQLFQTISSPEYIAAIDDMISELKAQGNNVTAIVISSVMKGLVDVAERHKLRLYTLSPVSGIISKLGGACRDNEDVRTEFAFKGIGGVADSDLVLEAGDYVDGYGPFRSVVAEAHRRGHGCIQTNTNEGLEGTSQQEHLPAHVAISKAWPIGPLVAEWFEKAAMGDEAARVQHAKETGGDVLAFLDSRRPLSTVYVTTGSHMELEVDQAVLLIEELRKHKVNWVLVKRNETDECRARLGGDDGIVTAWSPQMDMMLHPALKCVLSHGGFGTFIEGVYGGQPFITAPVTSDQFVDTKILLHLGISLGCIADNPHQSIMGRKLTPVFKDVDGRQISELFADVFGGTAGETKLEEARKRSRALRHRLLSQKEAHGAERLEALRMDMQSGVNQAVAER